MVSGVERENEKHSWSDSATLSETMSIGTHWMRASSLRVRLSLSATKSLVAIKNTEGRLDNDVLTCMATSCW